MRGSLQAYKKVSVDSQLTAASPHKIVQMLMAGAIERLIQGKAAMQAGNIPVKGERLGKALDIIISLRSCLSMDDGGDIAKNLDQLYEFMITQISAANHKNDPQPIDDVIDIIRENAEHSMMSMAGLDDEADTFAPVIKSTKQRSVWLGVNLLTAMLAVGVTSMFEGILAQLTILAVLNSLVPSMGGVAGNQTLTLVIRGMALGHVGKRNAKALLNKEVAIGFLNGIIWALLIATVVSVWKQDLMLGAVIAFAMLMNMTAAGLAGVMIPLFLKRINIDPALAGGVIITTVTDVVGIFAFLGTATLLLT